MILLIKTEDKNEAIDRMVRALSQKVDYAKISVLHKSRLSSNPNELLSTNFISNDIVPYVGVENVEIDGHLFAIPFVTYIDNDCKINTLYTVQNNKGELVVEQKIWKNSLSDNGISFAGGISRFKTESAAYTIITCGNKILLRNEKTFEEKVWTMAHYAIDTPIVKVKSNNEIIVIFSDKQSYLVSYNVDLNSNQLNSRVSFIQSEIDFSSHGFIKTIEHNGIILHGHEGEVKISKVLNNGTLAPLYDLNISKSTSKKLYSYGYIQDDQLHFWIQDGDMIHLKKYHDEKVKDLCSYDLHTIRNNINKRIIENSKGENVQLQQLDKIHFIDGNNILIYDKNILCLLTYHDKKLYYNFVGGQSSKDLTIHMINSNDNIISITYSNNHTQIVNINDILNRHQLDEIKEANMLNHKTVQHMDLSQFPIVVLNNYQYLAIVHVESMTLHKSPIEVSFNSMDFVDSLI